MTMADIQSCLRISLAVHPATTYKNIALDTTEAALTMIQHIEDELCFAVVCELDGVVAGFMLGGLQQLMFSRKQMAVDTVIIVEPGSRGVGIAGQMVRAFSAWAEYMGAALVCVSSSSGEAVNPEGVAGFLKSGFVLMREVHL